jgi:hypothetical protein
MWKIDKDYINTDPGDENSRMGVQGETVNVGFGAIMPEWIDLPNDAPVVRFHMKDDDGQVYYGGWLHNDSEALNQDAALSFGKHDAGCTTIEVKIDGKWVQEIG